MTYTYWQSVRAFLYDNIYLRLFSKRKGHGLSWAGQSGNYSTEHGYKNSDDDDEIELSDESDTDSEDGDTQAKTTNKKTDK